jgi:hypothetical protein
VGARWLLALACFLHPALASGLRADGGMLRLSERHGYYRISVFTAPNPLRAGPVDVSVLVQDARTGVALPQTEVTVRAIPQDGSGTLLVQPATRDAATNKLFQSAVFDLPAAGRWEIEVAVAGKQGSAAVRLQVEAAEAAPPWLELWPWLGWPIAIIALFGIHQVLVHCAASTK